MILAAWSPELATALGLAASGLAVALVNYFSNRKKNSAESGRGTAEAANIITTAASTIITELQNNAREATKAYQEAVKMASVRHAELQAQLEEAQVERHRIAELAELMQSELEQARAEIRQLREEVDDLRKVVRHLGGDPDNLEALIVNLQGSIGLRQEDPKQ